MSVERYPAFCCGSHGGGTTMASNIMVMAISAIALSAAPALAQTGGATTPVQTQHAPQPPRIMDQDAAPMREMMREMMQEMMGQSSPSAEREREDRAERRGPHRWRDRDRMHRRDGMGRSEMHEPRHAMRGGMMAGMHSARMR